MGTMSTSSSFSKFMLRVLNWLYVMARCNSLLQSIFTNLADFFLPCFWNSFSGLQVTHPSIIDPCGASFQFQSSQPPLDTDPNWGNDKLYPSPVIPILPWPLPCPLLLPPFPLPFWYPGLQLLHCFGIKWPGLYWVHWACGIQFFPLPLPFPPPFGALHSLAKWPGSPQLKQFGGALGP